MPDLPTAPDVSHLPAANLAGQACDAWDEEWLPVEGTD